MAGSVASGDKHAGGRPTALTLTLQKRICACIKKGNFREVAAQRNGITPRTLHRWMAQGKKATEGPLYEFCHAVLEAEAEAEVTCVNRVIKASARDPKHAEWWLERKFPERWSSHKVELNRIRKELNALMVAVAGKKSGR